MMTRPLVAATSLALNGVMLAALAWQPTLAPPSIRDYFARTFHSAAASAASPAPAAKPKPPPRPTLGASLVAGADLADFVRRLRAAGFPPNIIRALVSAELSARYDDRMRAITEADPSAPFWKPRPIQGVNGAQLEEYFRLQRERAKLQRDLFADQFFASDEATATERRQFGSLSRQKIDQVQRIEDDYADMMTQVRAAMAGVTLLEDRAKLALLEREKQADLAGVLSPEELADYTVRSSTLAQFLTQRLGTFDPSEAEFRAVFEAQRAYGETVAPTGSYQSLSPEERQAAGQKLAEQLQAGLGAARYADYQRETDSAYQQLSRLAQAQNISAATAVSAYNMRNTVAAESSRIADDPALSTDEKAAALQTLAQNTRGQLLSLLGPTVGAAYVATIDGQYLKRVETGSAVSFGNGTTQSMTISNGVSSATMAFLGSPTFRSVKPSAASAHP